MSSALENAIWMENNTDLSCQSLRPKQREDCGTIISILRLGHSILQTLAANSEVVGLHRYSADWTMKMFDDDLQNPSEQAGNKNKRSFVDAGCNPASPIQTISAEHVSVM